MTSRPLGTFALSAFLCLGLALPVLAQASPPATSPGASKPGTEAPAAKPSRRSSAPSTSSTEAPAAKKEPTVGQMAGRDRMRKCAAEWKTMKASNKVEPGMKWPKFWSQCNTRLKEQKA